MGLDMYFTAQVYNGGGYDHYKGTPEAEQFEAVLKVLDIPREVAGTSWELNLQVGYLRKANAIHNWLVQNIQDGVDECQESYFSKEKIAELRDTIRLVLATADFGAPVTQTDPIWGDYEEFPDLKIDRDLAHKLLPTKSGFFFGDTDYDAWYVQNLQEAEAFLTRMLEHPALEGKTFYYRSSW